MADQHRNQPDTDRVVVREAFSAARELLAGAEADATRIRGDADRYVRQREAEAELLVAKARRLLTAAEVQAAAVRRSATGPRVVAPTVSNGSEADGAIDLDAPLVEPVTADRRPTPARRSALAMVAPAAGAADGLDGILASAIGRAVDRAFDSDA